MEASFGLGEALVSGLVNADFYTVRDGEVIARTVASKQLAVRALSSGGTVEQAIAPDRQEQPVLTDEQIVELAQVGRRIEAHFGRPQDIEWCLAGDHVLHRPEPARSRRCSPSRWPGTTRTTCTSPSATSR